MLRIRKIMNNLHHKIYIKYIKDEIFIFILENTDTYTQTYVFKNKKYDDVLHV